MAVTFTRGGTADIYVSFSDGARLPRPSPLLRCTSGARQVRGRRTAGRARILRRVRTFLSIVLVASLISVVHMPTPAAAAGPSTELERIDPVPVTQQVMG